VAAAPDKFQARRTDTPVLRSASSYRSPYRRCHRSGVTPYIRPPAAGRNRRQLGNAFRATSSRARVAGKDAPVCLRHAMYAPAAPEWFVTHAHDGAWPWGHRHVMSRAVYVHSRQKKRNVESGGWVGRQERAAVLGARRCAVSPCRTLAAGRGRQTVEVVQYAMPGCEVVAPPTAARVRPIYGKMEARQFTTEMRGDSGTAGYMRLSVARTCPPRCSALPLLMVVVAEGRWRAAVKARVVRRGVAQRRRKRI